MKKQYINISIILGAVFIIGILLGNIILFQIQENKVSIDFETQTESMMYLNKSLPIKHFLCSGATTTNDGEFINIILNEETTHANKENNIIVETTTKTEYITENEEVVTEEEITKKESIIKADHYACPIDEIYFTTPVREYTAEQRELLAKMLYCEARGSSWDGQVATCSAIINHIEYNRGDFGVLDKSNHFDPAPYYRSKTPNQMQYDVVDYVLSGHLIANVKYFRMSYYHSFGTPMFAIDGEYYSR